MNQVSSVGGQELRDMLSAATDWLEKSAHEIDVLNVYPVPDGDTGTNMLLTMRASVDEAYRAANGSASAVANAIAQGALIGARGNSGVILSQIWRGLAKGLADKEIISGKDMADALEQASMTAYKGISNPVEGTMLTVIRDASNAAKAKVGNGNGDLVSVMEAVVAAAAESVANTPNLLPVLKEAGVVDAGGEGVYVILDGALRYLKGEAEQMQLRKPQIIVSDMSTPATRIEQVKAMEEVPYGYCTEFLLKGEGLNPDRIRTKLKKKGESLIVVGDESTVRVHIHTLDPGRIIHYAISLGTIHQVSMRNMDEQHRDWLDMQKERMPDVDTAIIAVVSGLGLSNVFRSLGATGIVSGGQTMNPSTKDILQAVESTTSDKAIILPNNKNVILTAEQVQSLTKKKVVVIPTKTMPQGVAALLAFDYDADFETNIKNMEQAKSQVKSIEITRSVRSMELNGFDIKKKQAIGFLEGNLVAVGDDTIAVLHEVLGKVDLSNSEVITVYYGADTVVTEAEQVSQSIRDNNPQLQVDVVQGGQPHYHYIVSIE